METIMDRKIQSTWTICGKKRTQNQTQMKNATQKSGGKKLLQAIGDTPRTETTVCTMIFLSIWEPQSEGKDNAAQKNFVAAVSVAKIGKPMQSITNVQCPFLRCGPTFLCVSNLDKKTKDFLARVPLTDRVPEHKD